MDLKRIITHIMIGIVFVGTGFLCGYVMGNFLYTPNTTPAKEILLPQEIPDEPAASPYILYTPIPETAPTIIPEDGFLVQSSGNSIYIYKLSDTVKTAVKVFDVNVDMFPPADRELLKEGINAASIQNAYEIIENFTS